VDQGLVDWLQAEAPERRVYARPPLALALCQVRFATKFGLNDSSVAPFQEALESDYPNPDRQQQLAAIQVGGQVSQIGLQAPIPETLWKFTDETGDWTVTLTQDFVTLETRAYAHFDDFLARLRRVLEIVDRTIRPRVGRRIGLRYINEIRSTNREWAAIIQHQLLGALAIPSIRDSTEQAIQVLTLRAREARINLQHGVFPTGTTIVPKPGLQVPTEPFYLLDIDMYQDFNPPQSLRMDPLVISEHIEQYHETISRLFRWATTNEYRASLGEHDDVR
jgi:uncharacterized protein (TIGR04255 family)